MFVLGIDAGGTKTQCAVADEQGRILGEGISGPGCYQTCGIEVMVQSLKEAIKKALDHGKIKMDEIAYGVFGMSGADDEDDLKVLIPAVKEIMGEIGFEVVHDAWIGLRAAVSENVGVVSICGTGAGHVGQNRQGEKLALRNLDYLMGNLGGGSDLAEKALHYAFRSEEGTDEKTALEQAIPSVFQEETLDGVCRILKRNEMTRQQEFKIPIAVFDLAHKGDAVCQRLIGEMGYEEGKYAAAIIRRLHMEEEEVPVVLIGSLFRTGDPLLIDPFMEAVHETAPKAYPIVLKEAPVTGAVALALDRLKGIS